MPDAFDDLYLLQYPEVKKAFLEELSKIVDAASVQKVEEAVKTNNAEEVIKSLNINPASWDKLLDVLQDVYKQTGLLSVLAWNRKIFWQEGYFTLRNTRAERVLAENSSRLVQDLQEEMLSTVQEKLAVGLARGANPRNTALDLVGRINRVTKKREGGLIGLSRNQTSWSENVRSYLQNMNPRYLKMQLRDKRFDSVVQKAMQEKKSLTKEQIEKIVVAYNNRALKFRADAVARTETMRAINRGKTEAIEQGIEQKLFDEKNVKKWWDNTKDSRTREKHVQLGMIYNRKKQIPFREPFVASDGSRMMYPSDISLGASPSETINCRCVVVYDIDFIAERLLHEK